MSNGDTKTNATRPKLTCHYCKKPGQNRTQYRPLKRQNEQAEDTQNCPGIEHVAPPTVSQTTTPTIKITTTSTKTVTEPKETQKLIIHPMRHVGRQTTNHPTGKCYFGTNAANGPIPRNRRPKEENQVPQRYNHNISNEIAETETGNIN